MGIAKASEGMTFVKDGIETVRSKPWAEPVGAALGVTVSETKNKGLEGELKTLDINATTDSTVGQHDNAIRCVEYSSDVNATTSSSCKVLESFSPLSSHPRHQPQSSSGTSSLEAFLNEIELSHLLDVFQEEEITMDDLKTFNDDDLKSIGITKFGPRRRILNAISTISLHGGLGGMLPPIPPSTTPSNVLPSAPPIPLEGFDDLPPPTYEQAISADKVGDSLNASSTSNPPSFMPCSTEAVSSPPSTTSKSNVSSSATSSKVTTQSKLTSSSESIVSDCKIIAEEMMKEFLRWQNLEMEKQEQLEPYTFDRCDMGKW